jgi:hemin uptake protein HemP
VPRGTVFFVHDGQLYTMRGAGMVFDRAGKGTSH